MVLISIGHPAIEKELDMGWYENFAFFKVNIASFSISENYDILRKTEFNSRQGGVHKFVDISCKPKVLPSGSLKFFSIAL